jgi:hypothetical protein
VGPLGIRISLCLLRSLASPSTAQHGLTSDRGLHGEVEGQNVNGSKVRTTLSSHGIFQLRIARQLPCGKRSVRMQPARRVDDMAGTRASWHGVHAVLPGCRIEQPSSARTLTRFGASVIGGELSSSQLFQSNRLDHEPRRRCQFSQLFLKSRRKLGAVK